jgi:hypothetical protein
MKIIMILSVNKGQRHGEISRLLGPKDKDRSGKKKGYDGYDKGDLTKALQAMIAAKLIQMQNDDYYIVQSEETFTYILKQNMKIEFADFLKTFLESEYVNNLIKAIGFKSVISAISSHLAKRDFRDIAAPALLSQSATIEEYKTLPKSIEEYFNSMMDIKAMRTVGEKFQRDRVEVKRSDPAYEWMLKAFHDSIQQHDGAPYGNKVGNIEELEILRDLGMQGVLFYRKHLLKDFVSIFERRTNAENEKHIIKYAQLDNYLSPFTAYPVSHPIELLLSTSFGRLYEDAYLIDPKDMGFLLERAKVIFENFSEFSRVYIGSRDNAEAAIKELVLNWNMACARFETILGLLGQLGYDPEKSCFHLTNDGAGFQIVDIQTDRGLLGEADLESLEAGNLSQGFYEFDQTKFMRPVLLGNLGQGWQEQLVPIETIISGIKIP